MRSALVDLASQPLRNLAVSPVPRPGGSFGWGSYVASGATAAWTYTAGAMGQFSAFARVTVTVTGTPSPVYVIYGSSGAGAAAQVTPGRTYQLSMTVRPSWATELRAVVEWYNAAGTYIAQDNGPARAAAAGQVGVYTVTGTARAGAAWCKVIVQHVPAAGQPVTGSTLDGAGASIVDATGLGATAFPYADGGTPGWRWTGTAGASESVGYPYTLESIAGRPLAVNTATGTSVAVPDLPPLQGRTLYAVYDVADTTANYISLALLSDTSGAGSLPTVGGARLQLQASGVEGVGSRVDTANGSVNASLSRNGFGLRAVGRHTASLALADGMTKQTFRGDGVGAASGTLTPGGGLAFSPGGSRLAVTVGAGMQAAYVFDREHDEQTARRVMAWLARQYGATIPAGY